MHLKILIGVLCLGLAAASPKPAPKPVAKASPQFFQSFPGVQQGFYPGAATYFGQQFAAQPSLSQYPAGQYQAGHYDTKFSPSSYGASFGNAFGAQQVYPQETGKYYQSQAIPVPVAYSSANSGYAVQPANYYGAARLWPKALISPVGSPSPVPDNLARAYYAASTPSPFAFQSAAVPVTTPAPIPVPVKVSSRTSFTPHINYGAARFPVPVSTPATYVANYQQYSAAAPYVQRQPTGYSFSTTNTPYVGNYQHYSTPAPYVQKQATGYSFSTTSAPYVANYQKPATRYQVNYQSTPAPFQVSYQHSTPAPQVHYQSTPAPVQIKYQPTPAPAAQATYKYQQQSTPAYYPAQPSYQANYQIPAVSSRSPFASYKQPTYSPYIAQHPQQSVASFGGYYQSTGSPFSANYQRIPVPVAYPQYQAQSVQPAVSYPVTSKPISVLPTSSPPVKTVSITENTFVPVPTTPTPIAKPVATIIKSEYNTGTVSPQYNQVSLYSPPSPYASVSNAYLPQAIGKSYLSYAPASAYAAYSPSTAVSHVSYNGAGHSYSY